jgi:hypothetical protein
VKVKHVSIALVLVIAVATFFAACSSSVPTPTAVPTQLPPTAMPPTEVPPTATPATHAQAAAGKSTFQSYCTCHGDILAKTTLAKYSSAQTLYNFISSRMPPSNSNVVNDQQRYDIIAYSLFTNGLIPADQPVRADTLANIKLAK